ncbi:cysteine--tRNA ligase [Candidatus Woesearchaeota archaeon]|nr:cysteine--tRNA ligase [Candidatus Woesearchaeota archaeon]
MLKVYNTLTRKKETFKPIKDREVSLYTCGPTVYNYAHIGNFRAYIFGDLLKRYLEYKGYKVNHVMNLTDVDDKTIAGSQKEGVKLGEFTERYSTYFFEDIKTLNIEPADTYPKATGHISGMAAIIKKLLKKGLAYRAADGIYYSISKFRGYGKLAQLEKTQLKAGARVLKDEYDKESAQDFALWKFWDKEDGEVFWETELGRGRPGWHIECSAMSTCYLGQPFDIHTGGIDLMFPHHENEIAQSEGAYGKKFVNYWMHCAHLIVDGKKMSKSLGNFYTLRDLLEKGYSPKAIRYLLLATHYRQQLNFTFEELKAATRTVEGLIDFKSRLAEPKPDIKSKGKPIEMVIKKHMSCFEKALDDDLNISEALAAIFELVREGNRLMAEEGLNRKEAGKIIRALERADKVLGILEEEKVNPEKEIEELVMRREDARKMKNWKEADRIRELLKQKNIILEDTKEGIRYRKPL